MDNYGPCDSLSFFAGFHRSKRELYGDFVEKHIIFVKEGRKPTYELFKGRLPSFADTPSRTKHSYIMVPLKKSEREPVKRKSFIMELDKLISTKIRNGGCREKLKNRKKQEKQIVKPNTCKNTITGKDDKENTITFLESSNYFLCPIKLDELPNKPFLVEFNVQDKGDVCQFSEIGEIMLGAGKRKNVATARQRQTTDWFLVNHLENSEIKDAKMCFEKK